MNVSDIPQPKGWLDATGKVLSQVAQHLLADLRFAALWLWASGSTSQRPPNPVLGQIFYDTTVGALFYCSNPGTPASGTPATWALVDAAPVAQIIPVVQTGFLNSAATSAGAGEDAKFVDTTITAVSAINQCYPDFKGAISRAAGSQQTQLTARLTSTTNLRISDSSNTLANITGRWYVIDFGT